MKAIAIRLIFFVVGFELLIVGATVAGCLYTQDCSDRDSDNITHMLSGLAAKSFALYAAEK